MIDFFSYEKVSQIIEAQKDAVENNRNYQLLYKGFLHKIWDSRINHKILFCIVISPENVDNLQFENLKDNLDEAVKSTAVANLIKINNFGNLMEKQYLEGDTATIKEKLVRISLDNYVFFFGEEGITRFINGRAIDEKNIFYSRQEQMKYNKKKDIAQINEVMDEYEREYVTQQVHYMTFFADNSTLRQIDSNLIYRNILRNKPEHLMRDQLIDYLTEHMQYTFTPEPELGQSKKKLDIYFDVRGELYFIEIKWLGVSINDQGTGLSTEYADSWARNGVTQTLEYIEELMNSSEKGLRHGYLAIYDARDVKNDIDFQGYAFVREELKRYIQNFSILKIISLEKKHPA